VVRDARRLPGLAFADVRLEAGEARGASAENGAPRSSRDDETLGFGVRVLAGDRSIAAGHAGSVLGPSDITRLPALLREALERAWRRAVASAEAKATAREKFGVLGEALADTRLHAVAVREDVVPARYEVDPRAVALQDIARQTADMSRQVREISPQMAHAMVSITTGVTRQLYASSDGALIDQAFALTEGAAWVVAATAQTSQALFDVMGHQRGLEIVERGVDDPLLRYPPLIDFAVALARDALDLVSAPRLPTSEREAVVVTDPHYNALLAHEIIGHPVELDRALKMETAYAGRSWLFDGPQAHQVGQVIASPLVSAYSDPSLPGYGHYRYDHEGTPGRRVVHIDRGVFRGFMNSRQTAAVFGGEPNGHWIGTEAALVPLVRMSTTVFAGGTEPAERLVEDVERGWYLAGHRTPSIAESRENFRISARKVYAIEHGRLGRLYREGGIAADSRDFLMHVDAVGDDFRLYPIPNCGKGQPMQVRKLGNGGPTLRSRARLTGS
jgi:TldD protein